MKTKNDVQKAVLRSAAVITSFVLLSFTVSAQDFWRKLITNSSFNEIAIAMVEAPAKSGATSATAATPATEAEPAMQLESWMTTDRYFNVAADLYENEYDNPLDLESWMLNEEVFAPVADTPLEVEEWMVADARWNF